MNWHIFHHPDISWPVVRRRSGIEFMELLELVSLFLCKGGWGMINKSCYPSDAAYKTAVSRLRKQGLVVRTNHDADTPQLELTETAKGRMPIYYNAEKYWNRNWNSIWYLLIYDVPEADRKYRNVLRQFLKRKRMGRLQQSVWITPEDIRPDFDDLSNAASIDDFSYLFESKTVLGLPSSRIVQEAWNFGRLQLLQEHYCSTMQKNLELLRQGTTPVHDIAELIRISVNAYHAAMAEDPLLPSPLLPDRYRGKEVQALNRTLFAEADRQLTNYI